MKYRAAFRGCAIALAALAGALFSASACAHPHPEDSRCGAVGTWLDPATGTAIPTDRALAGLAQRPIVLLGEAHDNAEHHLWQLSTLAALHGLHPDMVVGFESFPRRVQPILDQWVAGELDAGAFLDTVDWATIWGFDPHLYLPLFEFARQNRVPMLALNVDRDFVSRVRRDGWAGIPADERQGLSDPAAASTAYRESLAEVYGIEQKHAIQEDASANPHEAESGAAAQETDASADVTEAPAVEVDVATVLESEDFARFVAAQLTWDRAMAEALVAARRREPGPLVVGILGRGHVEHRYGVPHQLADLGIPDAATAVPVERAATCDGLDADLADAVFVIESASQLAAVAPKPRLGVMLQQTDAGVQIVKVMEGSVAAAIPLQASDIVVRAAGFPIAKLTDLVEIVQRQAPGTWLPLTIRRDEDEIEFVAKFPTTFESPE